MSWNGQILWFLWFIFNSLSINPRPSLAYFILHVFRCSSSQFLGELSGIKTWIIIVPESVMFFRWISIKKCSIVQLVRWPFLVNTKTGHDLFLAHYLHLKKKKKERTNQAVQVKNPCGHRNKESSVCSFPQSLVCSNPFLRRCHMRLNVTN